MGKSINFWLISDTHFSHRNICKYCNRPKDFETIIINNLIKWKRVNGNDVLIHLGDFAFKDYSKWTKIWNDILGDTKRILVIGNHEHKSVDTYLKDGWSFVCDDFSITYKGKKILFSHKPTPDCGYDFNIHGHCHNKLPTKAEGYNKKRQKLVKMEHNYKPIALNELIK